LVERVEVAVEECDIEILNEPRIGKQAILDALLQLDRHMQIQRCEVADTALILPGVCNDLVQAINHSKNISYCH